MDHTTPPGGRCEAAACARSESPPAAAPGAPKDAGGQVQPLVRRGAPKSANRRNEQRMTVPRWRSRGAPSRPLAERSASSAPLDASRSSPQGAACTDADSMRSNQPRSKRATERASERLAWLRRRGREPEAGRCGPLTSRTSRRLSTARRKLKASDAGLGGSSTAAAHRDDRRRFAWTSADDSRNQEVCFLPREDSLRICLTACR